VATNAKKNIANILKKNKETVKSKKKEEKYPPKKKKEETTKTPITTTTTRNYEEAYKDATKEEDDKETSKEEDNDEKSDEEDDLGLFEDSDEDYDEDDYYEDGEEGADGDSAANIRVKDVVIGELIKLQEETESYKLKGGQDEAQSQFRSRSVRRICSGECRIKEPNPKEEIYKTRTIELGIFTDKYLWNTMKEQVQGTDGDDEKVKKAMLEMIHSLFVITETFFLHPSISAEGEYHLVLNGITLFKDDSDPIVEAMHASKNTNDMLDHFEEYAKKKNDLYDGNANSYDMMILLSGSHANLNLPPGGDSGLAGVGNVCEGEPVLMSTLSLQDGMHLDNAGVLVAHEMGHMLGANHDGEGKGVTCPLKQYIMTPTVWSSIKEWSTCSRKQFDESYVARQTRSEESGNCFFT